MTTMAAPISSTFPSGPTNPTPLQFDAVEHACWQMEAMNAILEASFLPPVKKGRLQRAYKKKESVSETELGMQLVDLPADDDKRPVSPMRNAPGSGENDGTCRNERPTYNEGNSLSPPNSVTHTSNENSKTSTVMFSCFPSVRKIFMALPLTLPLQRRDNNKPSARSPVDPLSPPSMHAAAVREEENVCVRRVKRKLVPAYQGEPSPGQRLRSGPTPSSSCPQQRLFTAPCLKETLNIDDFELKKVLAYGGQGKVYLASFRGNLVAIKVVEKQQLGKDSAELAFVLQEQRVLRTLNSPFILSLEASFCDPSFFYLVTEYHGGGELHQALADAGRFDECAARFYIAEMALGIDHLHKNGIIHRDIKLMNILIKNDGHVAIADMGLVLDMWSPTRDKDANVALPTCCGTVPYMSPEVLEGKSHGEAVDLWALGVCTYLMLTGSLPWYGLADRETIFMILDDPVPFTKEIPLSAAARLLVAQLLMKDPSLRLNMDDLYIHPFFHDADWTALERLEVRPPFIPIDCRPALAKTTLLAHERITPYFSTPFFIDQFSEYTYIKPNSTLPMMVPPVAAVTPVTTLPALTLACAGNERSLPSSPAPNLLHQSLHPEQPPAMLAEQVKDDTLLSIDLGAAIRHHQPVQQSIQDREYRKGWTQPKLFRWLLGLGRRVVSAFSRRSVSIQDSNQDGSYREKRQALKPHLVLQDQKLDVRRQLR